MATPPFLPDETKPGSSDLISLYPSVEQTFRDVIEDWLLWEHNTGGTHKQVTLDDINTPTIPANKVGLWHESGVLKTRFAAGSVTNLLTAVLGVLKNGDTMTGLLILSGNPGTALGAATKQIVDLKAALAGAAFTGEVDLQAVVQTTSTAVSSASSISLLMSGANKKRLVLDHNTTITVSGEVADQIMEIEIEQGSTGGTASWSGVDKWFGGSAPTLSTVTGEIDVIILQSRSNGSTILGQHIGEAA